MSEVRSHGSPRQRVFYLLLILVGMALALLAILLPSLLTPALPAPKAGQVAQSNYRAPTTFTYVSQIITDQRREAAARAVIPVYTAPDARIARQQLESLSATLTYITSVRADVYASTQQKLDDLAALDTVRITQDVAATLLELTDTRWQTVQQEAFDVLERVMRGEIRQDSLDAARQRVPLLVSLALAEKQAQVVAGLVTAFVAPNSQYSESMTEEARQKARDGVVLYSRTLVAGETIVSQGEVFTAEDIEALEQAGLAQPESRLPNLVSASGLVLLLTALQVLYFRRERIHLARDPRSMTLIVILFVVFAFAARLTLPARTVIPYAFPLAAYGLIIAALFGAESAIILALGLSILAAYGLSNVLDLTLYYALQSLFGILILRRARRMSAFFYAGAAIAIAGIVVVAVYRLPNTDAIGFATLMGAALFNGLASAGITLMLQFVLAQFLGMTTPMQLVELSRPDHPLLQLLLRDASGTYQHSLQVANLAEQAAERIGVDPLLTRIGALYHDIGKSLSPMFFIENQLPGFINPHDVLEPVESAEVIIRHVADGYELGRKARLPRSVLSFILEHHGTLLTRYQYVKALQAVKGDASKVDMEKFRYPGPRPQSRETAILMLADGSEARVRAERPKNEEDLHKLIQEVIRDRIDNGQLDDTRLTMRDLNIIADSFAATLRGIYHPRVKYPKMEAILAPEAGAPAPAASLPGKAGSGSSVADPTPGEESEKPENVSAADVTRPRMEKPTELPSDFSSSPEQYR